MIKHIKKFELKPTQFLSISFMSIIFLGTMLLWLPISSNSGNTDFLTAFFTSTSAACISGLLLVDTATHWSFFGQIVILLLIQVGGLGIVSFAVFYALILGRRIYLRERLILQTALDKSDPGGVVNVFKNIIIISLALEAMAAIILTIHWTPSMGFSEALWNAIFHSISSYNNAGFDIMGGFSSLTAFAEDITVLIVTSICIIVGGLGFVVLNELYNYRKGDRLSLHTKTILVLSVILIVVPMLIILYTEYNRCFIDMSWSAKILASFFQSVTTRTAGFNTVELAALSPSTHILMIILMFIGASPGSTAGGIKTTTLAILYAIVSSMIRGKKDVELGNYRISPEKVNKAITILMVYIVFVFIFTFLILFTHESDPLKVFFDVCSGLGTVGLSLGLTAELSIFGKYLMILIMFLGRVGPLTLAFALANRATQPTIRQPEGKISIG